jgi:Family of unknown function (DUF5677)
MSDAMDQKIALSGDLALVALALGHRVRSFYRSFLHALDGPSEAALHALLRPMIEAVVLLPWLALDPDLHLVLWRAEHERTGLAMLNEIAAHGSPDRRRGAARAVPEIRRAQMREVVAAARALGKAADYSWVGEGSVLPNLEEMMRRVNSPEAWEAYTMGYRHLSSWGHLGAASLIGTIVEVPGGVTISEGPPKNPVPIRLLAAIAFAHLLELVSADVGLGIETEALALRREMLS